MFVARDGADIVLASHHDGGELANVSRHRRFLSKAASSAIRRGAGPGREHRLARSSASTAPSILREGYAEHGDTLIRERGFACKAELLIKLSRLGAPRGRGPRDARLGQAARARARCACCRRWPATRA